MYYFANDLLHHRLTILFVIPLAILLDFILGEPKRYHPLAGFGRIASAIDASRPLGSGLLSGALCWCVLVLPFTLLVFVYRDVLLVQLCVLVFVIGHRSLRDHATKVQKALDNNDIALARKKCSLMVSRDTSRLDANGVSKAVIESVLENGSDSITAPIFWFAIAGASGAIFYRLSNTLDAMWGYKKVTYREFGCFSARMDDVLNWLPARLTSMSYAARGRYRDAIRCWATQAHYYTSPNAGPVMASGAGALNVCLGGEYAHDGVVQQRQLLGVGADAQPSDISRALSLVLRALVLFSFVMIFLQWVLLL